MKKDETKNGELKNKELIQKDQKQEGYEFDEKEGKTPCVAEEISYALKGEKKQGEYTVEDYYALPDDVRAELIDGVIYVMESPSFVHQDLLTELMGSLIPFFAQKKGSCRPMMAPLDVRLDCDDKTMVQPDVIILCDQSKIRKWGIMGAPDFCLEVISKSTMRKDCIKKLQKYVDAGVKEYWILDPYKKRMLTYCWKDEYTLHVHSLEGSIPVELYDGELEISLERLAALIKEYPE